MSNPNAASLTQLGFNLDAGNTHLARTYMLDELQTLLAYVTDPDAPHADYVAAIVDDNCLTGRTLEVARDILGLPLESWRVCWLGLQSRIW